jgi:hypothetical protein
MARIIEIPDAKQCPSTLTLHVGDVLVFRAPGGLVQSGNDVVEMLGAFVEAVVGEDGKIYAPVGPPNSVLFRALRAGRTKLEIVTSNPFSSPRTAVNLTVNVEES